MISRWRKDTPGCDALAHLNNAGASLTPRVVHQTVAAHLRLEDELGGYEAFEASVEPIRRAYDDVGTLLGTRGRNIAFTQNSTLAFMQALEVFDFAPGDVIVTSNSDYASNQIMYLSLARRRGVDVVRAPDAPEGARSTSTRAAASAPSATGSTRWPTARRPAGSSRCTLGAARRSSRCSRS